MLAILAAALLVVLASLVLGRALLTLIGWPRPHWLAGAAGLAALVVLAPFLVRLPGRALTAGLILLALTIAAATFVWVRREGSPPRSRKPTHRHQLVAAPGGTAPRDPPEVAGGLSSLPANTGLGMAVVVATLALASLPFAFHGETGVLGQGIYTNDHAAQLYWADWLRDGFGPQPSAVRFGYPVGPQALVATVAELTGISLIAAFNGLLLAIPALTGLAALGALGALHPAPRILAAALSALPYLAASFLAQSAFKETAMALFLLAFAIALGGIGAERRPTVRATALLGLLLAAASVLTFSLPGLAWFALAVPAWLGLEAVSGRSRIDLVAIRDATVRHRRALAAAGLVALALAAVAFGPATDFVERIDDVQSSAGRLGSPVFPGEALGIWPHGDFRIVRGEVALAWPALALGALAAAVAALVLVRRRDWSLVATLGAAVVVYLLARPLAEIHVEAKALAIAAPLAMLVILRSLLAPPDAGGVVAGDGATRDPGRASRTRGPEPAGLARARQGLGVAVAVCALASTLLALRAAPVAPDARAEALEQLGERIEGRSVAFLGVDRFASYRLRGALVRAPAGYVAQEIKPRPEKAWQQGDPADFDSLAPGQLDRFAYAITTAAAHQSEPPASFEPVAEEGGYVLWRRTGDTPPRQVLSGEGGEPGESLDCAEGDPADGIGTVIEDGDSLDAVAWELPRLVEDAAAGQERAFEAPGVASAELEVPQPGRHALSLQYHSQVPLEVIADGEPVAELPANLDGMYLSGAGLGAFWTAGEVDHAGAGPIEVTVRALEPDDLGSTLGAERRVWLGGLAATARDSRTELALERACGLYVDHFTVEGAER